MTYPTIPDPTGLEHDLDRLGRNAASVPVATPSVGTEIAVEATRDKVVRGPRRALEVALASLVWLLVTLGVLTFPALVIAAWRVLL